MSWSISCHGKVPAVKKAVEGHTQQFEIAAEQRAYDAAKQSILATLECCDENRHVFLNANGSAYTGEGGKRGGGAVHVSLNDYPSMVFSSSVGTHVEGQTA